MSVYPISAYRRQSAASAARGFRGPLFVVVVDDRPRPRPRRGVSTIPELPRGDLYDTSYRRIALEAFRVARVFGRAVPYVNYALLGLDAAELAFGPLDTWVDAEAPPLPQDYIKVPAGAGWELECTSAGNVAAVTCRPFPTLNTCGGTYGSPHNACDPSATTWMTVDRFPFTPTFPPIIRTKYTRPLADAGKPIPEWLPDGAPGVRHAEQPWPDWLPNFDPMLNKPLSPPARPQPKPLGLGQAVNAESVQSYPLPASRRLQPLSRRRPGRGVKENKLRGPAQVAWRIERLLRGITESLDVMEAIYRSLPYELRRQQFQELGYRRMRPQDMADLIYRHWQDLDGEDLIINLAANEFIDHLYGTVGGALGRETARQLGRSLMYGPVWRPPRGGS